MIYFLLVLNILLLVTGQALWKIGLEGIEFKLILPDLLRVITNPFILTGLFIYGFATFIWLYVLSKSELSAIYPMQSLCYVIAAFVGLLIFKEQIPAVRWFGISLIVLGSYFVSIK